MKEEDSPLTITIVRTSTYLFSMISLLDVYDLYIFACSSHAKGLCSSKSAKQLVNEQSIKMTLCLVYGKVRGCPCFVTKAAFHCFMPCFASLLYVESAFSVISLYNHKELLRLRLEVSRASSKAF